MSEDLIKRLENAQGPDRELDALIYLETQPHETWNATLGFYESISPHYTASIDDALTLVPKGHGWEIYHSEYDRATYDRATVGQWPAVLGHTPILALCIAALRARAWRRASRWASRHFAE